MAQLYSIPSIKKCTLHKKLLKCTIFLPSSSSSLLSFSSNDPWIPPRFELLSIRTESPFSHLTLYGELLKEIRLANGNLSNLITNNCFFCFMLTSITNCGEHNKSNKFLLQKNADRHFYGIQKESLINVFDWNVQSVSKIFPEWKNGIVEHWRLETILLRDYRAEQSNLSMNFGTEEIRSIFTSIFRHLRLVLFILCLLFQPSCIRICLFVSSPH